MPRRTPLPGRRPAIAGLALTLCAAATSAANAEWVDIATAPLASATKAVGVAWGDFDNDGDFDLYLTRYNVANLLLRNEGGGVLVDATTGPLADAGLGVGSVWGDVDGDGDLDLCLTNDDGTGSRLFQRRADGFFLDVSQTPVSGSFLDHAAAWADFDNDGDLDIYIGGHEPNRLLRNDGGLTLVALSAGPFADPAETYGVAWGDYDDDGDPDLYVASRGPNRLLRNDGAGTFTDVTADGLGSTTWGRGAAWTDVDNDGDLDLYLTNDGAANKLFRNDGGGVFVEATPALLADPGNTRGLAWGDYDNDGDLDVYLSRSGPNMMLRNDGGGSFVDVTGGVLADGANSEGVAWADIDGDGDLDLAVADFDGPNRLFRNDTLNGNHWLDLRLRGIASNFSGVGARVRLVTGAGVQIREISGGAGWASQNAPYAHFGLGSQTSVDSLIIRWPSGIVQAPVVLAIDKVLTITEQAGATPVEGGTPVAGLPVLYPTTPNPFNASTRIQFELPVRAVVRLMIFDPRGRQVRTLLAGAMREAGRQAVTWDGRDDEGRTLSSGVYTCWIEAGTWSGSGRISLVK